MPRTAIILAFPELADIVDGWRLKSVEVARNGVPPHITLLFPWKDGSISTAEIGAVSELCGLTESFDIEFHKLKYFDSGTVYFSLKNDHAILNLSKRIWARFPETPPYGGEHMSPIPHLTVAQGNSQLINSLFADVSFELAEKLPISAEVKEVSILEEDFEGMWHTRARISLS